MLKLVTDDIAKREAQAKLEQKLKQALPRVGVLTIGFPGGNLRETVYSRGAGQLWFATHGPKKFQKTRKFWNAFGVFYPEKSTQIPIVEINPPSPSNSGKVSGFFAIDDTGEIYLMHTGRVGGGRPGIGKVAFLAWTKSQLWTAQDEEGSERLGIPVAALSDPDLEVSLTNFVQKVRLFKEAAVSGKLESAEFADRLDAYRRYSPEFTGLKRGRRKAFEYTSYHGLIVDALYEQRAAAAKQGERVFNSPLIDLFVEKGNRITEVYEVKTAVDRQCLYTAIGQLMTHSAQPAGDAKRFLIAPAGDNFPPDIENALGSLAIQVLRFRLRGSGAKRSVELLSGA